MKKLLALLLSALMLMSAFPVAVSAKAEEAPAPAAQALSVLPEESDVLAAPLPEMLSVEAEPAQKNASDFTYVEQNGGAYITGANQYPEEMIIPSEINGLPVLGIGNISYWGAATTSLTIPDSVETITGSFYLPYLEKISIGKGVKNLEQRAFTQCENLKSITVSAENEFIASIDGIVYNAAKDTILVFPRAWGDTYHVPASVKNVDVLLGIECDVNIVFPAESEGFVQENGVVYNKEKTKVIACDKNVEGKYVMPDSVTEIAPKAFMDCAKLSEVVISKNVTDISYAAFYGCKALKAVELPKNVKSIGICAFALDESMESIALPEGLEKIDYKAFFECKNLTTVNLPETLAEIGGKAFYGNAKQTAALLTLPASLQNIDYEAFSGTAYTAIHLGEGTPYVGRSAFSDCRKLESLTFGNNFSYNNFSGSVFSYCTALKNIDFGTGLKSVGEEMFRGCSALEKVTLPENIGYVGSHAFSGCTKLDQVLVEGQLSSIGEGAFFGCAANEFSFAKGAGVRELDRFAFRGISATAFVLPDNVTTIGYAAFIDSKNLASLDIPESVVSMCGKTMNGTAWYEKQEDGMLYLEHVLLNYKGEMPADAELTVKDGIRVIGDWAFQNQRSLSSVTLSKDVRYFGYEVFYCSAVKNVYVDEENPYFSSRNGMLYNKEGTVCYYAPIDGVKLSSAPYKTEYKLGQTLSFDGMELELARRNGENDRFYYGYWEDPNAFELVEKVDMNTAGKKTVKINYAGHIVEFEINVLGKASLSKETAAPGDEVSVTLSIDSAPALNSVAAENLSYDQEKLELLSVEWLREDFKLSDWNLELGEGVATLESGETDMCGAIAKLNFRVKEDASEGPVSVSCNFLAKRALQPGETEVQTVSFDVTAGKVEIRNYVPGDLDGVEGVSSADAIYLLYHTLLGNERYPVSQPVDYNKDGAVTSADAIYLLYHALLGNDRYPI